MADLGAKPGAGLDALRAMPVAVDSRQTNPSITPPSWCASWADEPLGNSGSWTSLAPYLADEQHDVGRGPARNGGVNLPHCHARLFARACIRAQLFANSGVEGTESLFSDPNAGLHKWSGNKLDRPES
jgi:hypothetical protein